MIRALYSLASVPPTAGDEQDLDHLHNTPSAWFSQIDVKLGAIFTQPASNLLAKSIIFPEFGVFRVELEWVIIIDTCTFHPLWMTADEQRLA